MCTQHPARGGSPKEATLLFPSFSVHIIAWEKIWQLVADRPFLLELGPSPKAGLEEDAAPGKQESTAQDKALSSLLGAQLWGTKNHNVPAFHPSTFSLVNP